jgi:hypothetical protein
MRALLASETPISPSENRSHECPFSSLELGCYHPGLSHPERERKLNLESYEKMNVIFDELARDKHKSGLQLHRAMHHGACYAYLRKDKQGRNTGGGYASTLRM